MNTITLTLPESVELDSKETIKFIAAKLYESGRLSLGQGSELAGLSKTAFAEILGDYGVSFINYPVSEIKKNAGRI